MNLWKICQVIESKNEKNIYCIKCNKHKKLKNP